jgi:hypothetical protein
MPAESFIIRELTGTQREVCLNDNALPYRPVEYDGEQAHVQTWYPGNPVATIQVLGPREGPMTITGMWKTSKLVGAVKLTGFPDIPNEGDTVTAEDLVSVFNRIRIAGNQVEVRWASEVRRGLLHRFKPNYHRIEDIEWSMDFVWSQRGSLPAMRAARVENPAQTTTAASNKLADAAAAEPPGLVEAARDRVRAGVDAMRQGVATFAATVAQIQSTANVVSARFQQAQAIASEVADAGRALRRGAIDLPYTEMLPIDDVVAMLKTENWRRNVGAETRRTQAATLRGRDAIAARSVPGFLAVVTLRQNQTLRHVALEYYGTADAWTAIADANGLVGSMQPVGTVVRVPRAPAAGSGVNT